MENHVPAIKASLHAKLEGLLKNPLIADIEQSAPDKEPPRNVPFLFGILANAANAVDSAQRSWREEGESGNWSLRVRIDYDDAWRGCEKEILQAVKGTIDQRVVFLTDQQRKLLMRAPREFLGLNPAPEDATLVSFRREFIGGSERVTELTVAESPKNRDVIAAVAVVPNLVQIERQLAALDVLEAQAPGSILSPLRMLVGLPESPLAEHMAPRAPLALDAIKTGVDEYQRECIQLSRKAPHFAVIQGPPGAGKTTVITEIVRLAVEADERVLIVSPTHVAVDNVVKKLVPADGDCGSDPLAPMSLPIRYASRETSVSLPEAKPYWVSSKRENRSSTVARRVQHCLENAIPEARGLFADETPTDSTTGGITAAVMQCEQVVCGTPIGILSCSSVKDAAPGTFDVLIVDEVSKMTLPEFLAIAVKAKRWVLVGDPEQLPPYSNAEDNGATLDDVFDSEQELAASILTYHSNRKSGNTPSTSLVVVARSPQGLLNRFSSLLKSVQSVCPQMLVPRVRVFSNAAGDDRNPASLTAQPEVLVCSPQELHSAIPPLAQAGPSSDATNTSREASLLVERGIGVHRPAFASGIRLVDEGRRCQAVLFDGMYGEFHTLPWMSANNQVLKLPCEPKLLGLLVSAGLAATVAQRFAVNSLSVFDWLTGVQTSAFKAPPLSQLKDRLPSDLIDLVRPFVGRLKKQYRMHPSISGVPRKLFYGGEALLDGKSCKDQYCGAGLCQVDSKGDGEANREEAERTFALVTQMAEAAISRQRESDFSVMIITPYGRHESLLKETFANWKSRFPSLAEPEICTLDKCQGREMDNVIINLVRRSASAFMDSPKRWNVALTRAKKGLLILGNIDAYRKEARDARRRAREGNKPGRQGSQAPVRMSLLARIIEEYDRQIRGGLPG